MKPQLPDATNVTATQPGEIRRLFSNAPFQWWIAGGWALDLFIGQQTRPHFDVDVAIARRDQNLARQYLSNWDFSYAVRTEGELSLRPWRAGEILGHEVHGLWARQTPDSPWCFEFWLGEIDNEVWTFRYHAAVQHPVRQVGQCTTEGITYLKPEIALLYKAARMRQVDVEDFRRVLPRLSNEQRFQLKADLLRCWSEHPWLGLLK